MGELFDETFYTTDFDKEMMDFIEEVYSFSDGQWDCIGDELAYGTGNNYFWTNTFPYNTSITSRDVKAIKLTKQQFKDKIGMIDKVEDQDGVVSYKLVDKEGFLKKSAVEPSALEEIGSGIFTGRYLCNCLVNANNKVIIAYDEFEFFEKIDNKTSAESITENVAEPNEELKILSSFQGIIDKCKNTNTNLVITGEGVYILDCINSVEYKVESDDDYEGIINAIELLQRKEVGVEG